jgi:hypothetical protein
MAQGGSGARVCQLRKIKSFDHVLAALFGRERNGGLREIDAAKQTLASGSRFG